jgi:hypothetical protein
MTHAAVAMVYVGKSNARRAHNTPRGVVYRSHWFKYYRCPVCRRLGRRPMVCKGSA